MNPFSRFLTWFRPPETGMRAAAAVSTSGRPSYAGAHGMPSVAGRRMAFNLLQQYYRNIPALGRTVDVLAGFVGVPEFECSSKSATQDLNDWAQGVPYGDGVGLGLKPWLYDLLAQSLIYGFGVGEAAVSPGRNDVAALWTYLSPSCGFESDGAGKLTILQAAPGGRRRLDPERAVSLTYRPQGCDPNGESLFFSIPTVAQTWLDILHAYRSTWRRCGIPMFHVNWEPPATFNDSAGTTAARVVAANETAFNEAIRSQVVDGKAKDFFSAGKITVTTIGADGQVIDIKEAKRNIVEEIVVATGVPGWMLGYATWSSTERLSTQQADILTTSIKSLRTTAEGALRKVIDLRQRLTGRRNALRYEIGWPDINLQDARMLAAAELAAAQAQLQRQRYAEQLWWQAVWGQAEYAEYLTGSREVQEHRAEPILAQSQAGEVQATPGQLSLLPGVLKIEERNGKH